VRRRKERRKKTDCGIGTTTDIGPIPGMPEELSK